ncbi:hypothetical protein PIL02S_04580 [Paenibacillus illinoisensis]|uniref:Uncharacterized protein n=1 Tax=Paenibacillus illinoisensis TaxID=59845 RepID=A0A2W0C7D3_9BACL|nr:hypothetical protein PIL02S_04580 [Paenibacillus illinoisensis]
MTPVLEATNESVSHIFNKVVIGAINTARQVIPDMVERGEGNPVYKWTIGYQSKLDVRKLWYRDVRIKELYPKFT